MGYKERLQQLIWDIPASVIAYRMNIHANTARNWKNGTTDMSLGSFVALIKTFNLDANYIIKGESRDEPIGIKREVRSMTDEIECR